LNILEIYDSLVEVQGGVNDRAQYFYTNQSYVCV